MQSLTTTILEIVLSVFLAIFSTNEIEVKEEIIPVKTEQEIMKIVIDKIDVYNKIYDKNSSLNNIDKNVLLLKESDYPDKENGTVLIGGHSGTGGLAYFKRLDELITGDEVKLYYKDKEYKYTVDTISKDSKDGKIRIDYGINKNRLIIYTCHPNDKQSYLVINLSRRFT